VEEQEALHILSVCLHR